MGERERHGTHAPPAPWQLSKWACYFAGSWDLVESLVTCMLNAQEFSECLRPGSRGLDSHGGRSMRPWSI